MAAVVVVMAAAAAAAAVVVVVAAAATVVVTVVVVIVVSSGFDFLQLPLPFLHLCPPFRWHRYKGRDMFEFDYKVDINTVSP